MFRKNTKDICFSKRREHFYIHCTRSHSFCVCCNSQYQKKDERNNGLRKLKLTHHFSFIPYIKKPKKLGKTVDLLMELLYSNVVSEALTLYGNRLTEYEKTEIDNYSKIWYLGLNAHKINGDNWASQNGGYDDDSGNYNKVSTKNVRF